MGRPDDGVQSWLDGLSFKAKKKLALAIKEQADGLAEKIKDAAPVRSGALRDSVKVRRKKNDLDLEVTAGGDATTRGYNRSTDYASPVIVDGRDNSGKSKTPVGQGYGVSYDYSRAVEFGTKDHPAEPFFFNTYRANKDDINKAIQDAVEEAINS
ncbi:HK97-gp10 family putative phage morphogenesis protein [Bradyrhizobium australafricanum]|uniref:HK97-gp10 family putative phage morphogenesis protein n=1 Tax=Bradyrhizobium australafricanum TaxID=2821406 RepID=UPI001CE3AC36|nr:HK97-gp10 family putative phage morphogenesis protein [Bradyrhizobium australafricanum]MCA6098866.1 HK97 gp10 family phage protein [Bradyrhizobium australafricanum]